MMTGTQDATPSICCNYAIFLSGHFYLYTLLESEIVKLWLTRRVFLRLWTIFLSIWSPTLRWGPRIFSQPTERRYFMWHLKNRHRTHMMELSCVAHYLHSHVILLSTVIPFSRAKMRVRRRILLSRNPRRDLRAVVITCGPADIFVCKREWGLLNRHRRALQRFEREQGTRHVRGR